MNIQKISISLIIALVIFFTDSTAQSYFADGLSPEFHRERRKALREMMPENSVALFFTNPLKTRSNDTEFTFRPASDFYYLSGFREPNAALLIFKNPVQKGGVTYHEILFIQDKDPQKEQWDGERMGQEKAKELLQVQHVLSNKDFPDDLKKWIGEEMMVLRLRDEQQEAGRANALLIEMMAKAGDKQVTPAEFQLDRMMSNLRGVKTREELVLLKKAIEISGHGHIESMRSTKPGVSERAIQGVHEFVHKAMDAEFVGYGSIVGSGNNSCILHYVDNAVTNIQEGVILMDVGAEYRGYSGDITRTIPVKGKFSAEEKAIYEIVLKALEASIAECKPGSDFRKVGQVAKDIIDQGLVELGLVKAGERHPYFPHGIGHHLGLDVHDRGGMGAFVPGMVITVEPGIYIPNGSSVDPKWWGIGIRIEDNILITESGHENLSAFVPKTVEEIEKLMAEEGILQKLKND